MISKLRYDLSDIKRYRVFNGITKIKKNKIKGDGYLGNPNFFEKQIRSLIQ